LKRKEKAFTTLKFIGKGKDLAHGVRRKEHRILEKGDREWL